MIWTDERKDIARATCRKWEGTPHRNRVAIPGQGIDCVRFVAEVLFDAGITPRVKFPFYDHSLGAFQAHNVIETILTRHLFCERCDQPEFGDIVVCRAYHQNNHVGIFLDGKVWHVAWKNMVTGAPWGSGWKKRTQSLLRIFRTGLRCTRLPTWDEIRALQPE